MFPFCHDMTYAVESDENQSEKNKWTSPLAFTELFCTQLPSTNYGMWTCDAIFTNSREHIISPGPGKGQGASQRVLHSLLAALIVIDGLCTLVTRIPQTLSEVSVPLLSKSPSQSQTTITGNCFRLEDCSEAGKTNQQIESSQWILLAVSMSRP